MYTDSTRPLLSNDYKNFKLYWIVLIYDSKEKSGARLLTCAVEHFNIYMFCPS